MEKNIACYIEKQVERTIKNASVDYCSGIFESKFIS